MKKKIYLIATILTATAALFLSSCLKDNAHYINFNTGTTFVDFPLGGFTNYSADAITESPDTDAKGTIVRQFAVNVASANLPTKPTVVTLAVGGQSDVDALNKLQSNVSYVLMPANAYSFTTTTVTIPAGQQYATTSVTFYKALLDPSVSYLLPIKIVSGTGAKLTANLNIHYYHFIGNDFAGAYEHFYTRWNNADSTTAPSTPRTDLGPTTFSPVSATEFTVTTAYYTGPNYDVTFTKTGTGANATYSNWAIQFLPADVAAGGQWASNITVVTPPKFVSLHYAFDPSVQYTYAQSLTLMRFYFKTASRAIIDDYTHL
jgi:hypothetical protein